MARIVVRALAAIGVLRWFGSTWLSTHACISHLGSVVVRPCLSAFGVVVRPSCGGRRVSALAGHDFGTYGPLL